MDSDKDKGSGHFHRYVSDLKDTRSQELQLNTVPFPNKIVKHNPKRAADPNIRHIWAPGEMGLAYVTS